MATDMLYIERKLDVLIEMVAQLMETRGDAGARDVVPSDLTVPDGPMVLVSVTISGHANEGVYWLRALLKNEHGAKTKPGIAKAPIDVTGQRGQFSPAMGLVEIRAALTLLIGEVVTIKELADVADRTRRSLDTEAAGGITILPR
jgi:hypothetical protein